MKNKNIYWVKFKSNELKSYIDDKTVVVIAVGSCEQHGFHLPLETDTTIGYRLIEEAALLAKEKVLILPPIWVGYSPHHMDFCGSITLRQATFSNFVLDICVSLDAHKIKNILIINSHGGNVGILRTVVDELGASHNIYPILVTYYNYFSEIIQKAQRSQKGGMGHAGELETSLQLYLSHDLVDTENLMGGIIEAKKYFQPGMFTNKRIHQYRPFSHYSDIGVIGEPRAALKSTGKELFQIMVQEFSYLFDDIANGLAN